MVGMMGGRARRRGGRGCLDLSCFRGCEVLCRGGSVRGLLPVLAPTSKHSLFIISDADIPRLIQYAHWHTHRTLIPSVWDAPRVSLLGPLRSYLYYFAW